MPVFTQAKDHLRQAVSVSGASAWALFSSADTRFAPLPGVTLPGLECCLNKAGVTAQAKQALPPRHQGTKVLEDMNASKCG
jgi:hypothetical protein